METPDVHYARSGDVAIAYQVVGESSWRGSAARTWNLVAGSEIEFGDRGVHEPKGIPGEWRLYAVLDA